MRIMKKDVYYEKRKEINEQLRTEIDKFLNYDCSEANKDLNYFSMIYKSLGKIINKVMLFDSAIKISEFMIIPLFTSKKNKDKFWEKFKLMLNESIERNWN